MTPKCIEKHLKPEEINKTTKAADLIKLFYEKMDYKTLTRFNIETISLPPIFTTKHKKILKTRKQKNSEKSD